MSAMAPYAKKSTLLMIASTRSGIMVFMQKVARTAAEAAHPTISTQNFISVPLRALKLAIPDAYGQNRAGG
jgi:hypothetical protein